MRLIRKSHIAVVVAYYALAPFVETFREMLEMRYLWSRSLLLDNRKLIAFLGEEPHTPLDEALRTTLIGLGCLSTDRSLSASEGAYELPRPGRPGRA